MHTKGGNTHNGTESILSARRRRRMQMFEKFTMLFCIYRYIVGIYTLHGHKPKRRIQALGFSI